jgi:hypothetical protein
MLTTQPEVTGTQPSLLESEINPSNKGVGDHSFGYICRRLVQRVTAVAINSQYILHPYFCHTADQVALAKAPLVEYFYTYNALSKRQLNKISFITPLLPPHTCPDVAVSAV